MTALDVGGPQVLHVGRPNVGDREVLLARIGDLLDRRWFTNHGPLVQEFEAALQEFTGAAHCVTVCNATTGIQVVARACGIGPGDEVIMPSFTWIATANALEWIGAVPIFCDIDPTTGHLDPNLVRELAGTRTRAVLGVHLYGDTCDTAALEEVTADLDIPLLFDAAHGFGCTRNGRQVGNFGDAEIFSFQATKFINSFEGGAIATNDPWLADQVRSMRNQGLDENKHHYGPGTVARMSEVNAAMGLTCLEQYDTIVAANRRNQTLYEAALREVPGVTVRTHNPAESSNCQYVIIEVADDCWLGRDELVAHLTEHGVLARAYFSPGCHQAEPYASDARRHTPRPLPHTERLTGRVVALPTGPNVTPDDVAWVCTLIADSAEQPLRHAG